MARPLKKQGELSPLSPRILSASEKLDWLRLIQTENVGPISFYQLLKRFRSAGEALRHMHKLSRQSSRHHFALKTPSKESVERLYERYNKEGVELIACVEPAYPALLKHLEDAPPLISVAGNVGLLSRDLFSVVGSRNASALGREIAFSMTKRLSEEGLVIVSGLAEGIDTAAHNASLETGTVAVVAGGVDHVYPPQNKGLYEQIRAHGVLVSESFLGVEPQARLFPRRNRLISGMSWGLLVVEAAFQSGSLITAHYAAEQGRQVFAVPGHPSDARAKGVNKLIQEGALLAEKAEDILAARRQIGIEEDAFDFTLEGGEDRGEFSSLQPVCERVKDLLTAAPTTLGTLQEVSRLDPALLRAAILELVLLGEAEEYPGGAFVAR